MDETRPEFASVWLYADRITGWLSRDQATVLFDVATALPSGSTVVEIGSHQGRSTVVLAAGPLTAGVAAFVAVGSGSGHDVALRRTGHPAPARGAPRHGGCDRPGRGPRRDLARRQSGVRRAGRPAVRRRQARLLYRPRRPAAGPTGCRPAGRSWSTTPSPRWGSRWACSAPWRPPPILAVRPSDRLVGLASAERTRPVAERLRVLEARLPGGGVPQPGRGRRFLRLHLRPVAHALGHRGSADPF